MTVEVLGTTEVLAVEASEPVVQVVSSTTVLAVEAAAVLEVTEPQLAVLEVVQPGPQGPTGPIGPPGPTGTVRGAGLDVNIAVASLVWTVEHDLGFTPNVNAYVGGQSTTVLVTENGPVRTVVTWSVPVAGRLVLS